MPELTVDELLSSMLDLPEGEILTDWALCYETAVLDGKRNIGYVLSPEGVDWKTVGMLMWVRRLIERPELVEE